MPAGSLSKGYIIGGGLTDCFAPAANETIKRWRWCGVDSQRTSHEGNVFFFFFFFSHKNSLVRVVLMMMMMMMFLVVSCLCAPAWAVVEQYCIWRRVCHGNVMGSRAGCWGRGEREGGGGVSPVGKNYSSSSKSGGCPVNDLAILHVLIPWK